MKSFQQWNTGLIEYLREKEKKEAEAKKESDDYVVEFLDGLDPDFIYAIQG